MKLNRIPRGWKRQYVTHILKSGKEKTDASSYRPISIICVSSKVLEHFIYSQVMYHLYQHNILSKYEHGYKINGSTETQYHGGTWRTLRFPDLILEHGHSLCQG